MTPTKIDHPTIAAPLAERTTERLTLRKFRTGDLEELAVVFEHAEVWQFPYGRGFTLRETADFLDAQIEAWRTLGFGCWIAREKTNDRVVGYVGLSVPLFLPEILPAVEVGWRFDPSVWGRGLASEGAHAALDEGFDTLGLDEICSVPQTDNPASSRVCERIGMKLERNVTIPANSRRDELEALLYKMTRAQWQTDREEQR